MIDTMYAAIVLAVGAIAACGAATVDSQKAAALDEQWVTRNHNPEDGVLRLRVAEDHAELVIRFRFEQRWQLFRLTGRRAAEELRLTGDDLVVTCRRELARVHPATARITDPCRMPAEWSEPEVSVAAWVCHEHADPKVLRVYPLVPEPWVFGMDPGIEDVFESCHPGGSHGLRLLPRQ